MMNLSKPRMVGNLKTEKYLLIINCISRLNKFKKDNYE